jgi:acyl carrier protein
MTDQLSVEDRVMLVLENMVLQGHDILNETTFEEMGLDSLDKIEACMDIEDEFNIDISDDAMEMLDTFGELVEYINRRLAMK